MTISDQSPPRQENIHTNNISLSTLFNLLKRVDKDSKLNSFKVLNEFSLESGLITFEETSINYVQKITN